MFLKYTLRFGHIFDIPPVISSLITSNKQQSRSNRIKSIQNSYGMPVALDAKLSHCKPCAIDCRGIREAERRAMFFKKHDDTVDIVLHPFRKFYPPCLKLISVFNCPIFVHAHSIAYFLYRGQSPVAVPLRSSGVKEVVFTSCSSCFPLHALHLYTAKTTGADARPRTAAHLTRGIAA